MKKHKAPITRFHKNPKFRGLSSKRFGIWDLVSPRPSSAEGRGFGISRRAGFTLIEIISAMVILLFISVLVLSNLSRLRQSADLDRAANETLELLGEARSKTLSSENALNYGVHFASSSATLFSGGVFSASDPANMVFDLPSGVVISAIGLSTTTANVVFERLTGESKATGTVIFTAARTNLQSGISILPSGLFIKQ